MVTPRTINDRARNMLKFVQSVSAVSVSAEESGRDFPEDRLLNRQLAADSVVLLKNDKKVLPLLKDLDRIALMRTLLDVASEVTINESFWHLMGYKNSLLDDLFFATMEAELPPPVTGTYEFGMAVYGTANLYVDDKLVIDNTTTQVGGSFFFGKGMQERKAIVHLIQGHSYKLRVEHASAPASKIYKPGVVNFGGGVCRLGMVLQIDKDAAIADAVRLNRQNPTTILCAGLLRDWESEGCDRADVDLPGAVSVLISAVVATNPNTVVVTQSGTLINMLPWADHISTLVYSWYGGNETGNGVADVVFGNVNPAGRLPLSFTRLIEDVPSFLNFGSKRGRVKYGERVYVGYRFYKKVNRGILFPFGHGLSYTDFEFSGLKVSQEEVIVQIKSIGPLPGAEVVQIYVATDPKTSSIARPKKELKGFTEVFLAVGETSTVHIPLDRTNLAELKETEAGKLNKEKVVLAEKLEEAAKVIKNTKNQLEEKVASTAKLETQIKLLKKQVEGMTQGLVKERSNTTTAKAAENKMKGELRASQAKLKLTTDDLNRLKGYTVPLIELNRNEAISKLQGIFEAARSLAEAHVGIDFDDAVLSDLNKWTKLKTCIQDIRSAIPLPRSNTPEAKQMRVASFLAVLARQLDRHVFRPTYVVTESDELSDMILHLKDKRQANHLRSVLLRLPIDEPRVAQEQPVVEAMCASIETLLRQRDLLSFRASLEKICREVCETWRTFQRYKRLVTADLEFNPEYPDEWKSLPGTIPSLDGSLKPIRTQSVQLNGVIGEMSIAIWPVFVMFDENDTSDDLLLNGFVLNEQQIKDAKGEEHMQITRESRGPRARDRERVRNGARK
ncbi:hypothetical protein ACHAQH_004034 [Verticillium albo-atrum]